VRRRSVPAASPAEIAARLIVRRRRARRVRNG
jgi:hypothetical protein